MVSLKGIFSSKLTAEQRAARDAVNVAREEAERAKNYEEHLFRDKHWDVYGSYYVLPQNGSCHLISGLFKRYGVSWDFKNGIEVKGRMGDYIAVPIDSDFGRALEGFWARCDAERAAQREQAALHKQEI